MDAEPPPQGVKLALRNTANAATSSGLARAPWMRIYPGSMRNGMREFEMQPLSGAE